MLHPEWEVGTSTTPYSYTPKGRLCLVTPSYPSREIRYLSTHRHKVLYEELGSQWWYLQPLGYSILQGTPHPRPVKQIKDARAVLAVGFVKLLDKLRARGRAGCHPLAECAQKRHGNPLARQRTG